MDMDPSTKLPRSASVTLTNTAPELLALSVTLASMSKTESASDLLDAMTEVAAVVLPVLRATACLLVFVVQVLIQPTLKPSLAAATLLNTPETDARNVLLVIPTILCVPKINAILLVNTEPVLTPALASVRTTGTDLHVTYAHQDSLEATARLKMVS